MRAVAAAGTAAAFLIGILAHEWATHHTAVRLGDNSPRMYRRLSFSYKSHADVLGSYVMPVIFTFMVLVAGGFEAAPFGWGKPHAIQMRSLRNQKRDPFLVALAGPAATGLMAVIAGAISRTSTSPTLHSLFGTFGLVMAALTIFEILPIPGRDGARILQRFLSPRAAMKFEELAEYQAAFMILLILLFRGTAGGLVDFGCRLLRCA